DGDNIKKSELARLQYQNALHIFPQSESDWMPVVTTASSTKNTGIDTVWEAVKTYVELVTKNGYFDKNRTHQKISWMYNNINEDLKKLFYGSKDITSKLSVLEKDIISSKISPIKAAHDIIETFKKS